MMTLRQTACGFGLMATLVLFSGCTDTLKRPFTRDSDRTGTERNRYPSLADGRGGPADDGMGEVLGSNATDPMQGDVQYIGSALEEEFRRLDTQAKQEYERLKMYEEKQRELTQLKEEYEARHEVTVRKRQRLREIINLIKRDPSALSNLSAADRDLAKGGNAVAADTFDDNIFSDRSTPQPAAVDWEESTLSGPEMGSTGGSPSFDANAFNSRATGSGAQDYDAWSKSIGSENAAPAASTAMKTTILALDGTGEDATLILNAGATNGVERGDLFRIGSGKEANVVVVTKAYPTYSRAVPHPKFASAPMQVNNQATQINSLPAHR